jgi:lantibiotic modifying enzyme
MSATGFAASDRYLAAALDAARWIESRGISGDATLYSGAPGSILFFLELYRHTSNRAFLDLASAGADRLLTSVATVEEAGLYNGLSGLGFSFAQVARTMEDRRYAEAARRCVDRIGALEWHAVADIYGGASGTGLFLLWAAQELQAPGAQELAIEAGSRLIEIAGHPDTVDFPNFSHGISGIGYFLATLAHATSDDVFLTAAKAAAAYLMRIADPAGDGCVVYHHAHRAVDDAAKLYYLGWCHGPVGTARLFYRLYEATGDQQWMAWVQKAAHGVIRNGGPRRVVRPGEWDNVSVCCGVAGQAQFFLSLYVLTNDARYLALAREASDLLLDRATRDEDGVRWIQAEHRIRPELREAQTGYMQGAAGIGMWLLHMSAFERGGIQRPLVLPDNPFPY